MQFKKIKYFGWISELHLEAFIQEDLGNTSITLLSGSVMVEFVEQKKNFSLNIGDKIQVRGVIDS